MHDPSSAAIAVHPQSVDLLEIHPSVIAGVCGLAVVYWIAARRTGAPMRAAQRLAFAGALATILLALNGPVDALADARLFSAHMLQHLLLSLVMPPLLLLGLPAAMCRPVLRVPGVWRGARILTHPIIAFGLCNAVLIVMHLPAVFELMVRDQTVHVVLHLVLCVVGTILWWPLLSPLPELPRVSYPAQMLYLFLLLTPMAAVAAPITLSPTVLYRWYAEGPRPWGIATHADQVLGGLLMWVGAGFYLLCVFSLVFFRWARHEDRDSPPVGPRLVLVRRKAG
jgi:putative membrane protein